MPHRNLYLLTYIGKLCKARSDAASLIWAYIIYNRKIDIYPLAKAILWVYTSRWNSSVNSVNQTWDYFRITITVRNNDVTKWTSHQENPFRILKKTHIFYVPTTDYFVADSKTIKMNFREIAARMAGTELSSKDCYLNICIFAICVWNVGKTWANLMWYFKRTIISSPQTRRLISSSVCFIYLFFFWVPGYGDGLKDTGESMCC